MAGDLAYTALWALFPFLIFASSLAGFLGESLATDAVIAEVMQLVPDDVGAALRPAIDEAVRARSGRALLIGMALGLAIATIGVDAFRGALNTAFECHGVHPLWRRVVVDLAFVLVGSIGFIAATLFVVVWPLLVDFVPALARIESVLLGGPLRYVAVFVILAGLAIASYRWLPDVPPKLRQTLAGAVVATLLWLAVAAAFAAYLRTLAEYSLVYGSLAGVIVTLGFFYFSAAAFVFGAEINAAAAEVRGQPMAQPE